MENYDCSCWRPYPNELKKRPDGTWICRDKYRCCKERGDLSEGRGYGKKTHCVRIERTVR